VTQSRRIVSRGGAWRADVDARLGELAGRLAAIPDDDWDGKKGAVKATIQEELDRAHKATQESGSAIGAWLTGAQNTKAWEALHNAEWALIEIEKHGAVLAAVPRLLAWVEGTMDAGKPKEQHETALKAEMAKVETNGVEPAPDRIQIRGALLNVIAANKQRYAAVRTFRNTLIMVTVALAALLVGFGIWHEDNPRHFLPLCQEYQEVVPAKNGGEPKEETKDVCVTGNQERPSDIWIVLAVGALGGLLGIAFGFSEGDVATRYDPRTWQTLLKPVTGAATALAAVIFLQSGVVIELSIKHWPAVLGYALLFGLSQQLLTKMVDKRATSLITPTK
jgi:hypothetical protein